jgi:hypothetical protein
MNELQESKRANELLAVLRKHILSGGGLILGYAVAAEMIGLKGSENGRHLGQVVSRIDLASFNAGLPFLTLHWIRETDGKINTEALRGPKGWAVNPWLEFESEILEKAATCQWTAESFDRLQASLDRLPNEGTRPLWKRVDDSIAKKGTDFIRHNLHRRVK